MKKNIIVLLSLFLLYFLPTNLAEASPTDYHYKFLPTKELNGSFRFSSPIDQRVVVKFKRSNLRTPHTYRRYRHWRPRELNERVERKNLKRRSFTGRLRWSYVGY